MPGLVEDVSDAEDFDVEGGVNALQNGDTCYFCKKTSHQKRDCRKFEEWKKKNPHKKPGGTLVVVIPDHQFCVIIVGKRVIFHGSAEGNVEIKEGEGMADREADDGGYGQIHGSDVGSSEETGTRGSFSLGSCNDGRSSAPMIAENNDLNVNNNR